MLERLGGTVEHDVLATSRYKGLALPAVEWETFDLLDTAKLTDWLRTRRPAAVVHCAALVNVDACEKNPDGAMALHAGTTKVIADAITAWGGHLVYISTDSLFNGRKSGPYVEEDAPDPLNVYARSKREGEIAALASPGATVLRTNVFGWSPAERLSFAEWVLKGLVERAELRMFTDVSYSPIHVSHLADVVARVIQAGLPGLFHATGSVSLSKHDFAVRMARVFGLGDTALIPSSVRDAGLAAARPSNMSLSNERLRHALGFAIPGVDVGIAEMKAQYDSGWLARIKGRPVKPGYCFWELS